MRKPMKFIDTTRILAGALAALVLASAPTGAQAQVTRPASKPALASAEVVNVYPEDKRVLLAHGPIPAIGMSAMTMEFGVARPGLLKTLKKLKPGDRILFSAARVKGDYLITHLELAK